MSPMTDEEARKILVEANFIGPNEHPQDGPIKLWGSYEHYGYYGINESKVLRVWLEEGVYSREQLLAMLHFYPEEEK